MGSLQGLLDAMRAPTASAAAARAAAARAAAAASVAQAEAVELLTARLAAADGDATRAALLGCSFGGELGAPWVASAVPCLGVGAPLSLRLATCALLASLLDGAEAMARRGRAVASLDAPLDAARAAALLAGGGGGERGAFPSAAALLGDADGASADGEDDEAAAADADAPPPPPRTTAGGLLADALLDLFYEVGGASPAELPLITSAAKAVVAMSRAAKATLLRRGFLPALLGRIDDLRAVALTPPPGGTRLPRRPHPDARKPPTRSTPRSGAHHPAAADGGGRRRQRRRRARARARGDALAPARVAQAAHQPPRGLRRGEARVRRPPAADAPAAAVAALEPRAAALRTLLALLCNYVAHCHAAKASLTAYSDAKGRCLATLVVRMLVRPRRATEAPLPDAHWRCGWGALRSLATASESRAALLRAGLLPAAVPLLHRHLGGTDEGRAAPVLDFFANLAFEIEGMQALLRLPDAFGAILEGLESQTSPPARHAAALAVRNLAFSADGRAAVLAKPRAMPALLRALHPSDLTLAARAAAALWALIGRCERAKAVLRGAQHQEQLRAAERSLTAKAMLAPPPKAEDRALLGEALRSMAAVMSILRL